MVTGNAAEGTRVASSLVVSSSIDVALVAVVAVFADTFLLPAEWQHRYLLLREGSIEYLHRRIKKKRRWEYYQRYY
jgi:hypothetical protein